MNVPLHIVTAFSAGRGAGAALAIFAIMLAGRAWSIARLDVTVLQPGIRSGQRPRHLPRKTGTGRKEALKRLHVFCTPSRPATVDTSLGGMLVGFGLTVAGTATLFRRI